MWYAYAKKCQVGYLLTRLDTRGKLHVAIVGMHAHKSDILGKADIINTITELQIIFESNTYLPPNFWLNADFQNLKLYCHPYIFSQCVKEKVLLFWSAYLLFCVVLT